MYATHTASASAIAAPGGAALLAHTGLDLTWAVLTAVVCIACGAALLRLARSRPSRVVAAGTADARPAGHRRRPWWEV